MTHLDTSFHAHEMNVGPDGWERWITRAERLAGHDLDGTQEVDGYSYDYAMEAYDAGSTVEAYVKSIKGG